MEVNKKENNIGVEDKATAVLDQLSQTKHSVETLWQSHVKHERIDLRKTPSFQIQKMKRAFYGGVSQLLALQAGPLSKMDEVDAGDVLREFINEVNAYWAKEKAKK